MKLKNQKIVKQIQCTRNRLGALQSAFLKRIIDDD